MAGSNIIVPPDVSPLMAEREKVWADFDRSQNLSTEIKKLSSAVPDCAPAALQLKFGTDSTPLKELETVLPMLKEKIDTSNKLKAQITDCHAQIEAIKQKEKTIITIAAVAGGLVIFVVLILLISLVSGS